MSKRQGPGVGSVWLNLGTIVIAVLLAVATAVGFGIAVNKRAESPRAARPVPTTVAATSGSTGAGAARPAIAPVTTVLGAFDDRTVWAGRVGSCAKGGAQVSLTHDGGLSWSKRPLPTNLQTLTRVRSTSAQTAFIVGAGSNCTTRTWGTGDGGQAWSDPQAPADTWARSPRAGAKVVTPADPSSPACGKSAVVDLDADTDGGVVLCANGQILTSGTGKTWSPRDQAQGRGRHRTGEKVYAAEVDTSGCTGVRVSEVEARAVTATGEASSSSNPPADSLTSSTPPKDSCVNVTNVKAGSVALATVGNGGWLAIGSTLYRSDDLKRWDKARSFSAG